MPFDLQSYTLITRVEEYQNGIPTVGEKEIEVLASIHEDMSSNDIQRIVGLGYRPEKSILVYTDYDLAIEKDVIVYKKQKYKVVSAPNNQRGLLYKTQAVAVTDVS